MKRWVALALLVASCDGDRSMFVTANDRADQIATIGWIVLLGFTIVSVVMWGLLVWAARRRPGSFAEHAPAELEDGQDWIVAGGVVIPVIAFLAILIVSIIRMHTAAPMQHAHGHDHAHIRVVGHRWWWEVQYVGATPRDLVTSANEIHIPVGMPVTVELESADVIHSFWVPNVHGKVDLVPGHVNHITLEAREAGEYLGQCAEFCGVQHANMKLVVVAETPVEHEVWLARERQPALPALTADAIAGQQVFESKPCATCHAIRGTRALGRVGPDLTHVAARRRIAANAFPASTAFIAAWSTRAHSLKPGAQMPDLAAMSGEELTALTHYLMGLQ